MQREFRKAFTMIELVFVIVVIGILSAIALPRFSDTADTAYLTKAQSTLAAVRAALATEKQKRILMGDTSPSITALGSGSYAFSKFSADTNGKQRDVIGNYVKQCGSTPKACWKRRNNGRYWYYFPDGTSIAKFKLQNNQLICAATTAAGKKLCRQIDR